MAKGRRKRFIAWVKRNKQRVLRLGIVIGIGAKIILSKNYISETSKVNPGLKTSDGIIKQIQPEFDLEESKISRDQRTQRSDQIETLLKRRKLLEDYQKIQEKPRVRVEINFRNKLVRQQQGLQAAEQKLKADEQRLKANEQRLQANEQTLKATQQHLQATEQRLKSNDETGNKKSRTFSDRDGNDNNPEFWSDTSENSDSDDPGSDMDTSQESGLEISTEKFFVDLDADDPYDGSSDDDSGGGGPAIRKRRVKRPE